jgi:hypothetical protein
MKIVETPAIVLRYVGPTSCGKKYQIISPNGIEAEVLGRDMAADTFAQLVLGSNELKTVKTQGKSPAQRAVLNCKDENEASIIRTNLQHTINETRSRDKELSVLFEQIMSKLDAAMSEVYEHH